jgi:hypothetical protein
MARPSVIREGCQEQVRILFAATFLHCLILLVVQRYINRRNSPVIEEFFPNMKLEILDTGHWGKPL